jgi:hypothetical protein
MSAAIDEKCMLSSNLPTKESCCNPLFLCGFKKNRIWDTSMNEYGLDENRNYGPIDGVELI